MSDYPHFSELIRLRDWIQKHSVSEAALVEMIESRSVELFAHVRSTELIEIDDYREERSLGLEVENRFMPVYPGAVVDALLDNVPLVGNFLVTQNPIEHWDPNHDGTGQHFLCEPERIQVRDLYLSLTSIPSKPNANSSAATEIVTIENWQVVRFGTRKSKKLNEAQSAILHLLYITRRRFTMTELHQEVGIDLGIRTFSQIFRSRDVDLLSLLDLFNPTGTYKAKEKLLNAVIRD